MLQKIGIDKGSKAVVSKTGWNSFAAGSTKGVWKAALTSKGMTRSTGTLDKMEATPWEVPEITAYLGSSLANQTSSVFKT